MTRDEARTERLQAHAIDLSDDIIWSEWKIRFAELTENFRNFLKAGYDVLVWSNRTGDQLPSYVIQTREFVVTSFSSIQGHVVTVWIMERNP